jgi:hypothetical protein
MIKSWRRREGAPDHSARVAWDHARFRRPDEDVRFPARVDVE